MVQGAHHLAEMAYAGEDDLVSLAKALGVADEGIVTGDGVEPVLDGTEIAGAVVEDGDHRDSLAEAQRTRRRNLIIDSCFFTPLQPSVKILIGRASCRERA